MTSESTRRQHSVDATAKFIGTACDLLLVAFPAQIHSIYLLGSWARRDVIATSDVDIALVLNPGATPSRRAQMRTFIATLNRISETRLDVGLYLPPELKRGVTPYMKRYRVLAGKDLLKAAPPLPRPDSILFFAAQSLRFMRLVRGRRATLPYPLRFPSPSGRFHGYETRGLRPAGGGFLPGLNTLVSLVAYIAIFRLLVLAGEAPSDKRSLVARYRKLLRDDPWRPLVEETHALCRIRCQGRVPGDREGRKRLSRLCRKILDLENDSLDFLIMNLPRAIPGNDRGLRLRAQAVLRTIRTREPRHVRALAEFSAAGS